MFPTVIHRGGQEEEWPEKTSHGTNLQAVNGVLRPSEKWYRYPPRFHPCLQLDVYVVSSPVPQLHVGCGGKKGCFCLTEMDLSL